MSNFNEGIAQFEKVSFEQFSRDWLDNMRFMNLDYSGVPVNDLPRKSKIILQEMYDDIRLPERATSGSAGYDFFLPDGVHFDKDCWITIPTGIRCKMNKDWMLSLFPKSGLGFKHNFELANTIGVVDSDYYSSSNEGHIMVKCRMNKIFDMSPMQKFVQGIFLPYGVVKNDSADGVRDGGFGSTGA